MRTDNCRITLHTSSYSRFSFPYNFLCFIFFFFSLRHDTNEMYPHRQVVARIPSTIVWVVRDGELREHDRDLHRGMFKKGTLLEEVLLRAKCIRIFRLKLDWTIANVDFKLHYWNRWIRRHKLQNYGCLSNHHAYSRLKQHCGSMSNIFH